jgi:hypothetical protein
MSARLQATISSISLILLGAHGPASADQGSAYIERVKFAAKLRTVRVGDTEAEVQAKLGTPTSRRDAPSLGCFLLYSRSRSAYPVLGSVLLGTHRRVWRLYGTDEPRPGLRNLHVDMDYWVARIGTSPGFCCRAFRSFDEVATCRLLRGMGLRTAQLLVGECARVRPVLRYEDISGSDVVQSPDITSNDGRIALLVFCLFEGRVPVSLRPTFGGHYIFLRWLGEHAPLVWFFRGVPVLACYGVMQQDDVSYDAGMVSWFQRMRRWPKPGTRTSAAAGPVLASALRHAAAEAAEAGLSWSHLRAVFCEQIAVELGLKKPPALASGGTAKP